MEPDEKACPFCGETIKLVAVKCKHCQSDLSAQQDGKAAIKVTEVPRENDAPPAQNRKSGFPKLIGWALVVTGLWLIYYGNVAFILAFPALWIGFSLVFPGASWITRTGKGFVAMFVVMATAVAIRGGFEDATGRKTATSNTGREYKIGEIARARYFEVVVHGVTTAKRINPNLIVNLAANDNEQFIVIDATVKNIDTEGRVFTAGELQARVGDRVLKFDVAETVLADGYTFMENLNPLTSVRTKFVFKVPMDLPGVLVWIPARTNLRMALSNPATAVSTPANSASAPPQVAKEEVRSISTSSSFLRAPSYDCSKASTPTEQGICSSAKLSLLDAMMAYQYRANLANARDKTAFASGHKVWVAKRNECGGDQTCLERIYLERLQREIETAQVAEFFGSKGFSKGKDYPDGKRFCGTDYVKGSETIYVTTYCAGDGFYDIDVRQ